MYILQQCAEGIHEVLLLFARVTDEDVHMLVLHNSLKQNGPPRLFF
jgi:hypothetical protein